MNQPTIIRGEQFSDTRGRLKFFNAFNMGPVERFYEIHPASINIIRAWQAHKLEKKWFYCTAGAFIVNLVKIDNFESPSDRLQTEQYSLNADLPQVLEVPGGYANGFKATEPESSLIVFSNFTLAQSAEDDFRFSPETWSAHWEVGQ